MIRSVHVLVLALAWPGIAFAAQERTGAATSKRSDERWHAQRVEKRDVHHARNRAPTRNDRVTKAERDYWRFVAKHEIDADLAYDEEEPR